MTSADLAMLWRTSVRFVVAAVIAAFPLVLIIDGSFDWSFSPALPGFVLLILALVGAPFLVAEMRAKRLRRSPASASTVLVRSSQSSWGFLIGAFVWFLLWLSLGA